MCAACNGKFEVYFLNALASLRSVRPSVCLHLRNNSRNNEGVAVEFHEKLYIQFHIHIDGRTYTTTLHVTTCIYSFISSVISLCVYQSANIAD